jgi:hypothetical protein
MHSTIDCLTGFKYVCYREDIAPKLAQSIELENIYFVITQVDTLENYN